MELILVSRAIYPIHGFGGMERHCHDWIHAMSEKGCRVHVITMPPITQIGLSEFPKDTCFYFIPGHPARTVLRRITIYPRWVNHVREFLHSFVQPNRFAAIYANGLAAAGCADSGTPVYYNPHGMEEFKCSGLKRLAYGRFRTMSRAAARKAKGLIATDASLISEMSQFLEVPPTKIRLIPNSVFPQTTTLKGRRELGLSEDAILLLAAGRLEPNKGFDVLLKALSMMENATPFQLVIAGDGSRLTDLIELARVCRIEQRVKFTGALPEEDLLSLYAVADLFVHPTLYEGSSLVTLEAMRAGLPIVASNTGGLPDKVFPEKNGWLVPPGNARMLAATIQAALKERDHWKRMGEESARIVQEKYSWGAASEKFLSLFSS